MTFEDKSYKLRKTKKKHVMKKIKIEEAEPRKGLFRELLNLHPLCFLSIDMRSEDMRRKTVS